jgi:DNA-binding NarL/FixJ family response regulator
VTTLQRIAAHVEQRIGPIDVVVCDLATADAVDEVFAPDLRRRGHGEVVVVTTADEADDVVSLLVGRH